MASRSPKSPGSSPDIAIIGGGLAGFAFALACQNAGLRFTLYESKSSIWQHSSGIGLPPNALQALRLIDKDLTAEVFKISSQAKQNANFNYRYGQGGPAHSALDVFHVVPSGDAKTVLRSAFVNLLAGKVSASYVQFDKHLSNISEIPTGEVQVDFRDGSSFVHDVVVGCDGIHSQVRKLMFGNNTEAVPRFAGKVIHRGRVAAIEVAQTLGQHVAKGVSIVCGPGGHIVFVPIEGGLTYSLNAVASKVSWQSDRWVIKNSGNDLRQGFPGWDGRILDLLERSGDNEVWALFDLPSVPSLSQGRVAILGDAAHASTPFQGGGAAMALEDAYFLSNLLAQIPLDAALKAYDSVRRPRVQRQVQTSLETGKILGLQHERRGDGYKIVQELMSYRFNWLWSVDLEGDLKQLVAECEREKVSE